jgi:hypothetical protein
MLRPAACVSGRSSRPWRHPSLRGSVTRRTSGGRRPGHRGRRRAARPERRDGRAPRGRAGRRGRRVVRPCGPACRDRSGRAARRRDRRRCPYRPAPAAHGCAHSRIVAQGTRALATIAAASSTRLGPQARCRVLEAVESAEPRAISCPTRGTRSTAADTAVPSWRTAEVSARVAPTTSDGLRTGTRTRNLRGAGVAPPRTPASVGEEHARSCDGGPEQSASCSRRAALARL